MKIKTKAIICCILVLSACLAMGCEQQGSLTVITGPMYSGKTARLIDYIKLARLEGKRVQVYSHGFDIKRDDELSSRAYPNEHIKAFKTCNSYDIIEDYLKGTNNCVAIDEAQFFSPHLAAYIKFMLSCRATIYVAGLDTNFRGEPFSDTFGKICQMADRIDKLTAICSSCSGPATLTQRLINGIPAALNDELVIIEGTCDVIKYEPRCRKCHVIE